MNITLITTNSRPLRTKQLQAEECTFKDRVTVLPLTKALLTTFTQECVENSYISPFSIN
jgi:hypothetical protein